MKKKYPARTKEFPWEKVESNYLLVDKENNKSITLDPISFLIWTQCDGKTELDEIADIFSMGGSKDIAKATITGILDKLETGGLIRWE